MRGATVVRGGDWIVLGEVDVEAWDESGVVVAEDAQGEDQPADKMR